MVLGSLALRRVATFVQSLGEILPIKASELMKLLNVSKETTESDNCDKPLGPIRDA